MNIKVKAALLTLPLTIMLQLVFLIIGVVLFGNQFNLDSLKLIGVISGGVIYYHILKRLQQKSKHTQKVESNDNG